jgi:L-idonate 5-dehydrogenase
VQGALRREIVVETQHAHGLADTLSGEEGAMTEPLSVALHAVRCAGSLLVRPPVVSGMTPLAQPRSVEDGGPQGR